ncbi:hypothetical protein CS542_08785 [Pedobacter sp. IW39]|nr:hypothetical protein CS542_08785 [Pedobacter sp. IW39]
MNSFRQFQYTDLTKLTPQANTKGDGFSFAGRNSLFNSLTLDGAQMNNVSVYHHYLVVERELSLSL